MALHTKEVQEGHLVKDVESKRDGAKFDNYGFFLKAPSPIVNPLRMLSKSSKMVKPWNPNWTHILPKFTL